VIDEHGGKLVQTGGDSLLIAFDSIALYVARSTCSDVCPIMMMISPLTGLSGFASASISAT
jgi:hypothetical protein